MSDQLKFKFWEWSEWAIKLIIVGVFGIVWQNNADMQQLKTRLEAQNVEQDQINAEFRSRIVAIESGYMTRMEVLENLKRIELYMQNQVQQTEINRLKEKRRAPL
jgi:hypothetical protein